MAEINVKRFVNINILANVTRNILGTRGTLTLFTPEGNSGVIVSFNSLGEALTDLNESTFPLTRTYVETFFNHGGSAVDIVEGTAYNAVTLTTLKALANEKILVGFVIPDANVTAAFSAIIQLAQNMNADTDVYGVNQKILFIRSEDNSVSTTVPYLGVKYSNVVGAEMTMAAYLSKINVYRQNTVNDYSFTEETVDPEDIADADLETILNNNMNVDISLANSTRNVGGNLKDGSDLTNTFVRIVLHQTLTDRLLNLLVQKLKNSAGISQIYSAITQELEAYRSSGYYSFDKVWTDDDLTVVANEQQYTVIEKGTALLNGYYVKILPFSSLTDTEKAAHSAPYIYVILADQYGIRLITVNGEVI